MGTAQVPEQGTVSQGTGVPGAAGQEEPHLPQLHPLPSGAKSGCEKAHTKTNPVLREPCTVLGARALPHSHIRAGRFNWLCSPMNLLDVRSPRGRGPCQQWQRKDVCAKWCIPTTHAAPFIVPSLPSPVHPPGHPPPSQGCASASRHGSGNRGLPCLPPSAERWENKTQPGPQVLPSTHRCTVSFPREAGIQQKGWGVAAGTLNPPPWGWGEAAPCALYPLSWGSGLSWGADAEIIWVVLPRAQRWCCRGAWHSAPGSHFCWGPCAACGGKSAWK